jgi:hypothetical protein
VSLRRSCGKKSNGKDIMVMGINSLEVEVGNPANPQVTEKLEFLVDSGVRGMPEYKGKKVVPFKRNATAV